MFAILSMGVVVLTQSLYISSKTRFTFCLLFGLLLRLGNIAVHDSPTSLSYVSQRYASKCFAEDRIAIVASIAAAFSCWLELSCTEGNYLKISLYTILHAVANQVSPFMLRAVKLLKLHL